MSGQESLARSFMVLSFVSAGLIGVGHAFDSRPQQTSPQTIRRALAKSPKLLATHQQLAESIQPTRVALDEGSSPVSNSQVGDEEGDKNTALVGDRPSPRQQLEHRLEPITVLLSEQAVQLIASSGLTAGSSTPQTVDRENAESATASLALNRSTERSVLEPLNAQAQPPSSEVRSARESEAPVSHTAQSPILRTESQPTRTDSRADSRVSFVDDRRGVDDWRGDRTNESRSNDAQSEQNLQVARRALSDIRPAFLELSQQIEPSIPSSRIVVDLSDRQVTLWQDNAPATTFPIAVGRPGWETPSGEFEVINKKENPIWQNPLTDQIVPAGPENPLGTRWIGFWTDGRNQIGFHGTTQTELIGQAVSHGCIRMDNRHIEVLYDQIAIGVPVTITE